MALSWLLGIPFAGVLDPRFTHTVFLYGSPSPSLILTMLASMIFMGFLARRALNY